MVLHIHQTPKVGKLVIQILAISFLLLQFSCGSNSNYSNSLKKSYKEVIALELFLQTQEDGINNFLINKNFLESEEFIQFVESKIYGDSAKFKYSHQFLSLTETESLFKQSNADYLLNQLKKPALPLEEIVPKKFMNKVVDLKKLENEIGTDGSLSIEWNTINHIYLSSPIISKDQKYTIIWYARGLENSKETGIHLFELSDGRWKMIKDRRLSIE